MFEHPTYAVLDLPSPISDDVVSLRQRFDTYMASLPPEITVAGSSGIGVVSPGQDPSAVFHAIESMAAATQPIRTAFSRVACFPGTQIYWLAPRDPAPFIALQRALFESDVLFEPHTFAYIPHCTLSLRPALSDKRVTELKTIRVPTNEFVLDRLSLYQFIDQQCFLLRSFQIGSTHNRGIPSPSGRGPG